MLTSTARHHPGRQPRAESRRLTTACAAINARWTITANLLHTAGRGIEYVASGSTIDSEPARPRGAVA